MPPPDAPFCVPCRRRSCCTLDSTVATSPRGTMPVAPPSCAMAHARIRSPGGGGRRSSKNDFLTSGPPDCAGLGADPLANARIGLRPVQGALPSTLQCFPARPTVATLESKSISSSNLGDDLHLHSSHRGAYTTHARERAAFCPALAGKHHPWAGTAVHATVREHATTYIVRERRQGEGEGKDTWKGRKKRFVRGGVGGQDWDWTWVGP